MPQNLLDSDGFATGSPANGTALHTYNSNWVVLDLTNATEAATETAGVGVSAPGIGSELRNGFTWTNDQWAELKIDGTTLPDSRFLVGVRCTQGSGNNATGYMGGVHRDITGGTYQLYTFTNPGAFTQIGVNGAHSYAVGDVVNLQIVGTLLTLTVNGATEITFNDVANTYPTGSPALIVGGQVARLGGTWKAGSVGSADTLGAAIWM